MKYLSNYTEDLQSAAFDKYGAFFAFSNSQLEENAVKGVKYISTGSGLICPKEHIDALMGDLENIQEDGIKMDIAENGLENIIQRELGNYETQITGNWMEAFEALDGYPNVTEQLVKDQYSIFYQRCIDNDWF